MTKRQMILVLLLAVAVRLAYHQLVPAFDGSYDNGSDSGKYIVAANSILDHGEVVQVIDGEARPDFGRMPLYPHFVAALFWLSGGENLAVVTAVQAVISAFTVFAVGSIAGAMDRRWMLPATLLASVWPAFVVYTAWVLTDSLFVDLLTWGLCACIWAANRERPLVLLCVAGLAFGLALLTRPVLMFFPYLLVPALAYMLVARRGWSWPRAVSYGLVPVAIMLVMLAPRLLATHGEYGVAVVTTQSGNHALELVYPCLRDQPDCDRESINNRRFEMVAAALDKLSDDQRNNPVIVDAIERDVALRLLADVPPSIFVLAMASSALRSITQTMLYEVGEQLNQAPRFFSTVVGATIGERVGAFAGIVLGDGFMMIWMLAQTAVLLALPVQFIGLTAGLRDYSRRPMAIFLVVTAGYFLAINMSFGNPKYGLPLNPAAIVFLVGGMQAILDWRRRRVRHRLDSGAS